MGRFHVMLRSATTLTMQTASSAPRRYTDRWPRGAVAHVGPEGELALDVRHLDHRRHFCGGFRSGRRPGSAGSPTIAAATCADPEPTLLLVADPDPILLRTFPAALLNRGVGRVIRVGAVEGVEEVLVGNVIGELALIGLGFGDTGESAHRSTAAGGLAAGARARSDERSWSAAGRGPSRGDGRAAAPTGHSCPPPRHPPLAGAVRAGGGDTPDGRGRPVQQLDRRATLAVAVEREEEPCQDHHQVRSRRPRAVGRHCPSRRNH